MLSIAIGNSLDRVGPVVSQAAIVVFIMVAGDIVVKRSINAGLVQYLMISLPLFKVGAVREKAAVGGIGEISGIDHKQGVNNCAAFIDCPGEVGCILAAAGADMGVGNNHKPEKPVGTPMVVGAGRVARSCRPGYEEQQKEK